MVEEDKTYSRPLASGTLKMFPELDMVNEGILKNAEFGANLCIYI